MAATMLWAAWPACSGKKATNNSSSTNTVSARERTLFTLFRCATEGGGAVTPQRSAPHSLPASPGGDVGQGLRRVAPESVTIPQSRSRYTTAVRRLDYDVDAAGVLAARSPPFTPSAGRIAAAR
jgi:hypothetical protein